MKIKVTLILFVIFIKLANGQVNKVIHVEIPGTLKELFNNEEQVNTHLKITGNMNAVDFETLGFIPYISKVDISEVSIVEYNGSGGTDSNETYYPPNSIPNYAFAWCGLLHEVILPPNISSIGKGAFFNCAIDSIVIPDKVTYIGESAFQGSGLSSITIPNSVLSIGAGAFSYTNLTDITIPGSVTTIGNWIFRGCASLKSISIPESIDSIPEYMCTDCVNLVDVIIPSTATHIGWWAFGNCTRLGTVSLPSSLTFIGEFAFNNCISLLSIYSHSRKPIDLSGQNYFANVDKTNCILYIPSGTKPLYQIANHWKEFVNILEMEGEPIDSIKTIHLEKAGTLSDFLSADEKELITQLTITGNIDARDFKTIRDEMPNIEDVNFLNCNIILYSGTEGTYSHDQSESRTYDKDQIPIRSFLNNKTIKRIILPSTANNIDQEAFRLCENLTHVEIPNNVSFIGDYAFYNCHNIDSIYINPSVSTIGSCAFSDCSATLVVNDNNPNFSSIDGILFNKDQSILIQAPITISDEYTIPSTVKTIQHNAFLACNRVSSITIPNSVQTIDDYAFWMCINIASIKICSSIPIDISSVWQSVFDESVYSKCTLYVPKGSKSLFQGTVGWKEFANIIEVDFMNASNLRGNAPITFSFSDNKMLVNGLTSKENWELYNPSGQLIAKGKTIGDNPISIMMPENKFFIFKTDCSSYKIVRIKSSQILKTASTRPYISHYQIQ
jgi:hypothetical protein